MAGEEPAAGLPFRLILWWALSVNLIMVAGLVYMWWMMFEPLLEMARPLGQPPPSFVSFVLAVAVADLRVFVAAGELAAAAVAASCLFWLRRSRGRTSIRRIRGVCIGLLGFNVLVVLFWAYWW